MKIVLASNNKDKLREFETLFQATAFEIIPQSFLAVPEAEEPGLTFVENAILKARNACHHTHLPAIADDSGLCVDALQGKPGIYSARYAGNHSTYQQNVQKLLEDLKDVSPALRTARFYCVLAFLKHSEDPAPIIAEGIWEGIILSIPTGENGFGYDPIFFDQALQMSAAALTPSKKNQVSHRGQAMRALLTRILKHDDSSKN